MPSPSTDGPAFVPTTSPTVEYINVMPTAAKTTRPTAALIMTPNPYPPNDLLSIRTYGISAMVLEKDQLTDQAIRASFN